MTLRIASLTVLVDAYDRGIAFYRDVLGLRLSSDLDMGGGKRWVVVEGQSGARLVIAKASDERQRAAIGNQTGGRVGFFIETDDFAAEHTRLSVAVFEDPFGNKWDLIEPKT
jgi:catechol 2,3-dioxygenase-like lactoylglutathione lyase family enzyme